MKCPHCGHGHRVHAGLGATACEPGSCRQRKAGEEACDCPGWIPGVKLWRVDNPRVYRVTRSQGTRYVSPADESVDYSGWDDAA